MKQEKFDPDPFIAEAELMYGLMTDFFRDDFYTDEEPPEEKSVQQEPNPQEAQAFSGRIEGGFTPNEQDIITDALETAGSRFDISTIERVTSDDDVVNGDPDDLFGQVNFDPDVVWLDSGEIGIQADLSEYVVPGIFESEEEQTKAMVLHELVHVGRANVLRDGREPSRLTDEEKEVLREEVSEYAAEDEGEAVAEIGVLRLMDEDVSDEVIEIYRRHGGPEL